MKPDEFEEQLANVPQREAPPAWRAEILAAARAAQGLSGAPAPSFVDAPRPPWWRELLWPCPQAWAALAAVWALIGWIYTTKPGAPESFVDTGPAAPPEPATALALQRRERARLLENGPEPTPPFLPAPIPTGDGSNRVSPPRA